MLDLEIRKRLARYNAKRMKLTDLDDWLNSESWDVRTEPPETQQLLFDAMRLIAEHANGDWTDAELRQKLGALSRTYWVDRAPKDRLVGESSSAVIQPTPAGQADRPRVVASV
jgi:hypothetical protein